MMRLSAWLGALLGLQLLIAGALWWNAQTAAMPTSSSLLDLGGAEVTALTIADATDEVELIKTAAGWTLPALDNAAADADRISTLLERIEQLQVTWPVSRSAASHLRFAVTPAKFQRRMRVTGENGELATLYIGTSPGFRQAHARVADADAVYAIGLNTYDLPVEPAAWLQPLPAAEMPADESSTATPRIDNTPVKTPADAF
jgi:hypothetical protein